MQNCHKSNLGYFWNKLLVLKPSSAILVFLNPSILLAERMECCLTVCLGVQRFLNRKKYKTKDTS